jgi:GMP synthase (glutamine-hydrolysing)
MCLEVLHVGRVYILTPGGQYNHLIFRRVLELGYEASMRHLEIGSESLRNAGAVIIGGGPGRLSLDNNVSESLKDVLINAQIPVLGICYGHQLLAHLFGGVVAPSAKPEFGPATIRVIKRDELFEDVPNTFTAWLSHNDEVVELPKNFEVLADSRECAFQAVKNANSMIYGVQFHVEVEHTQHGKQVLGNFLRLAKR